MAVGAVTAGLASSFDMVMTDDVIIYSTAKVGEVVVMMLLLLWREEMMTANHQKLTREIQR